MMEGSTSQNLPIDIVADVAQMVASNLPEDQRIPLNFPSTTTWPLCWRRFPSAPSPTPAMSTHMTR